MSVSPRPCACPFPVVFFPCPRACPLPAVWRGGRLARCRMSAWPRPRACPLPVVLSGLSLSSSSSSSVSGVRSLSQAAWSSRRRASCTVARCAARVRGGCSTSLWLSSLPRQCRIASMARGSPGHAIWPRVRGMVGVALHPCSLRQATSASTTSGWPCRAYAPSTRRAAPRSSRGHVRSLPAASVTSVSVRCPGRLKNSFRSLAVCEPFCLRRYPRRATHTLGTRSAQDSMKNPNAS